MGGTGGIDGLAVWGRMRGDGGFEIEGQHLGAGGHIGKEDYEYLITVAAEDVPALARALGCADDGIVEAWDAQVDQIVSTRGERTWLTEHGIPSKLHVF
jgi:hypothetical protein